MKRRLLLMLNVRYQFKPKIYKDFIHNVVKSLSRT